MEHRCLLACSLCSCWGWMGGSNEGSQPLHLLGVDGGSGEGSQPLQLLRWGRGLQPLQLLGVDGGGGPARACRAFTFAGGASHSACLLGYNLKLTVTLMQTLNNQAVTYAADLWALGCILYQMLVGRPPFKAGTEYLTFQLIASGQVDIPVSLSSQAQDLLRRLLVPEASQRLGQIPSLHSSSMHRHTASTSYTLLCMPV